MRQLPILLLVVLLSAACGATENVPAPGAPPLAGSSEGYEGIWKLESGRGPDGPVPLVAGRAVTLELDGDSASGRAACNLYGGRVHVDGSDFAASGLGGTEMGCEPAVMTSEQRYYAALPAADTIEVRGARMTLTGPDTELRFRRVPPVPKAQLTGTTWELESLVDGAGADGTASSAVAAELTLLADGTFSGTTGCRDLTGTWSESAGEVYFDRMSADGRCPARLRDQDAHVVNVLGDGFTARIEGGTLTIESGHGAGGLVYRAG